MEKENLNILVKLHVKLGDTIMSTSFLILLRNQFPYATIDIIILEGLIELHQLMPYVDDTHVFSKEKYKGIRGNYKFAKLILSKKKYDLYFCLPQSFSSAMTGFFTKSKKRIGFNTEWRGFLLTDTYNIPSELHTVDKMRYLLEKFLNVQLDQQNPYLYLDNNTSYELPFSDYIVLNICAGPPSRYMPIKKAIEIIQLIRQSPTYNVVLTGSRSEYNYIQKVKEAFPLDDNSIVNLAGRTSLLELGFVLANASFMITTDTGNAHYANTLGTKTIVLFGPGIPHRCHPFNRNITITLEEESVTCLHCNKEYCKFNDNHCITAIPNSRILSAIRELEEHKSKLN